MKQSVIKTQKQIKIMRKAGKLLAKVLNDLSEMSKPGTKTMELEDYFLKYCSNNNIVPACKNYTTYDLPPFPTGLCISIDDQSVHCTPKQDKP